MSALARGLSIIEYVAKNQSKGVTFPQILAFTGLPQSSCFRVLKELTDLGYLCFIEDTRKYYVSMKIAGLGSKISASDSMRRFLRPLMEKMRDESNKTCNLGIMDVNAGIFLDVIYSESNTIKLLSGIGASFPLHCTALGKVLLTYASPEKREAVLSSDLTPLTPRTITNRHFLEEQFEQIKMDGYASEHEESTLGIHCFAVPIFDYGENNVAAVSMACPYFDFEKHGEPERIIDILKKYGAKLSARMGYQPDAKNKK